MAEMWKAVLFGIVEGVTEWLPVSSTGHMILLNEFVTLRVSPAFWDLFLVAIQLGAILAVLVLYFRQLNPFVCRRGKIALEAETCAMWGKIVVASVPAGIAGVLWDDVFTALFYNYRTVAVMLILIGVVFVVMERGGRPRAQRTDSVGDLTVGKVFLIGIFQMIAAVFPGTSRSGATIIGGMMLGVSRKTAAEFTFFLAIPAMLGGSAVRLLKYDGTLGGRELALLFAGMATAFAVSVWAIRFLMSYIKKHDFRAFGWYRISLGAAVLAYFFF